jgi:hypothetical protein
MKFPTKNERMFIEVRRTQDLAIAGLIKEVLEDNGIVCYLENYSLARIYPSLVSPIKVMVYSKDAEKARELLSLYFRED